MATSVVEPATNDLFNFEAAGAELDKDSESCAEIIVSVRAVILELRVLAIMLVSSSAEMAKG